jgi:small subunit ribosomal protein S15
MRPCFVLGGGLSLETEHTAESKMIARLISKNGIPAETNKTWLQTSDALSHLTELLQVLAEPRMISVLRRQEKSVSEPASANGKRHNFGTKPEKKLSGVVPEGLRLHKADDGSSQVQAAQFTQDIARMTEHLKRHPKDHACRRGLLAIVARRRKHLDYLRRRAPDRYRLTLEVLNLRR